MAQEINVAITGGAPYLPGKNFNTSAMVRNALPDQIKLRDGRTVKLIRYPHDIEASWSEVRRIIPQLLSGKRRVYFPDCDDPAESLQIDLLVQLGMRRSTDSICFETVARRGGYVQPDVDGKYLPPGDADQGGIWEGFPEDWRPSLDIAAAGKRVMEELPASIHDVSSRISDNANSFLCEFQFYSALAEFRKMHKPAKVEFVHMPNGTSDEEIQGAAQVVSSLIAALVEDQSSSAEQSEQALSF